MNREKLESKVSEIQKAMADIDVTDPEYDKLLTKLKETYKLLAELDSNELEYYIKNEEHKLKEKEFEAEQTQNEVKIEQAKKDRKKDIAKAVLGGIITTTSLLIVIYAEETRIITSKALGTAMKMIPIPRL